MLAINNNNDIVEMIMITITIVIILMILALVMIGMITKKTIIGKRKRKGEARERLK